MIVLLTRWRRRLVHVNHYYPNPVEQQRARLLLYYLWLLFLFSAVATLVVVVPLALQQRTQVTVIELGSVVMLAGIPALMLAVQRGYLRPASWLLILLLLLVASPTVIGGITNVYSITLLVPLVIAGTLLNWQGILLTLLLTLAIVAAGTANSLPSSEIVLSSEALAGVVVLSQTLVLCGIFLLIFSTRLTLLPPRFAEELQQLRMVAGLNLFPKHNDTEATYSNRVVDALVDVGGYAFVRILLLNAAGTQIEQVYIGSGILPVSYSPEPEPDSAISDVLYTRQTVTVDMSNQAARREHLLPGSVAGLLIPLLYEGQFLGILDIQTLRVSGFGAGEQSTLEILGRQFAAGLLQLRRLMMQQRDIEDQKSVIQRQRDRLQQLERADQQATINAWSAYLEQRGQHIFGYDVDEETLTPRAANDLPLALRKTLARGEIVVDQSESQQLVGVPILLRGQVVGGISFSLPNNRPVTRRQTEMISNVVQRLALALDNKRLFEQSQSQAQRESKANEIARLLLSSTDVETVLQLAAATFNEALGAVQTRIHLSPSIQPEDAL